jgi:hypothetical protein
MINFNDNRNGMTVKELLDAAIFCDIAEIIVRKDGGGQWIQGYRIGKDAKIYPSEVTAEMREAKEIKEYPAPAIKLKEGEAIEFSKTGLSKELPMKVICKDCRTCLPEEIGRLKVNRFQPRHIPSFHKDQATHNDYELEIDCYPEETTPMIEVSGQKVIETID